MAFIQKLKSTLTDVGGGEVQRYQCLNCGGTFRSETRPDDTRCPGCDSGRIRQVRD
jgi:DNA-directed RNA polymerase subunit RPC12/RpoP